MQGSQGLFLNNLYLRVQLPFVFVSWRMVFIMIAIISVYRRGNPLFLNEKAYQDLNEIWLSHRMNCATPSKLFLV